MTPTNASLFAVDPAIASDGTLTYTPAADANGTSTVSVKSSTTAAPERRRRRDATQTFMITVTPVNDAPSFTKGPDESTPEQVNFRPVAQTVTGWATGISAGPPTSQGRSWTS